MCWGSENQHCIVLTQMETSPALNRWPVHQLVVPGLKMYGCWATSWRLYTECLVEVELWTLASFFCVQYSEHVRLAVRSVLCSDDQRFILNSLESLLFSRGQNLTAESTIILNSGSCRNQNATTASWKFCAHPCSSQMSCSSDRQRLLKNPPQLESFQQRRAGCWDRLSTREQSFPELEMSNCYVRRVRPGPNPKMSGQIWTAPHLDLDVKSVAWDYFCFIF